MQQLTKVNHDDDDDNDDDNSYKIKCILLNTILMKNSNHDDEDSIGYNIILVLYPYRLDVNVEGVNGGEILWRW